GAFVCVGSAFVALRMGRRALRHDSVVRASQGMERRELVRGFLGLVDRARGVVNGNACVVSPGSLEIAVNAPRPASFDRRALELIARGDPDASLAQRPEAREAAGELLAARVRRLEIEGEKTRVHGAVGNLVAVARAAISLA